MGGGKSSTTTQSVQIPPEVLARYRAVNLRAEQVAEQPFQAYSGQFVAPLTQQQQAGMAGIGRAAEMAQPYYAAAAGLTGAGSRAVGPLTREQIQYYQDPYTESVVQPTLQALRQQQGQERAMQQAQAIRSGGFGGDRAGLERANLARQQALGMAQAISPLYSQGYQIGVQTAAGQQGVAAQDLQRQLAAGQQFAGLGTGAQQAALQGAQAQIGAGTLEQQTQQADLTARYQQFLQERGYPFQVAQFLANIAMGTGALSGSTTTTTQPSSFFSDERMKENIKPIGETFDGQTIYKYNYKGEPGTQIGLIAQEVEHRKPEAVGMAGGMKTVDYDRATEEAGGIGKALASMGGAVREPGAYARGGYAPGGLVDPNDLNAILASQRQSFGPFGQAGMYGQQAGETPFGGAGGIVPKANLPVGKLITAGPAPRQQESGLQQGYQAAKQITDLGEQAEKFGKMGKRLAIGEAGKNGEAGSTGLFGAEGSTDKEGYFGKFFGMFGEGKAYGGGVRPHFAAGGAGSINPYSAKNDPMDYFPQEVLEEGDTGKKELLKPGQAPGGGGGSGLSNAIGTASQIATIGTAAAKAAPYVMALFASDRRLKHDIEPIGKTYDGQNIYRYHMGDGAMRMGLMAQEVAEHKPEAVARGPKGFLMLDYDRATEDASLPRGGVMPREGLQEGGVPPDRSGVIDIIRREAEAQGVPFDIAYNIARRESSLDPNARAKTSSAGGLYQIIDPTFKALGVEGDKMDPNVNARAGVKYIGQNIRALREAGAEPTAGNVYLAHFLGTEGARRVLANPDAPLSETIPNFRQVVEANPFVGQMGTGRDIANWADTRMSSDAYKPSPGAKGQASGVKPSDFFGGPPKSFQTGKPFESYGDFFTSKQFVVPFLSGLGAMASSPSRYLGAAVLQGIGRGAESYANLEQQQAAIDQTKAATFERLQSAANQAFTSDGRFVRLADGRMMPVYEWFQSSPRPMTIGGREVSAAAAAFLERVGVGQPAGGVVPSGSAAPAEAAPQPEGGIKPPEAPKTPSVFDPIGPASKELAKNEAAATYGMNPEGMRRVSDAYVATTQAQSRGAYDNTQNVQELAQVVAKQIASGGIGTSGTAFYGRAELVRALNTLGGLLGGTERFSEADKQADLLRKLGNLQGSELAKTADQRSLGALTAMIEALPQGKMAPEAQAQLTAQILVATQAAKDRETHRIRYGELNRGLNSFTNASKAFEDDNRNRFANETELLKAGFLSNKPEAWKRITTGQATPDQIENFFKRVAEERGVTYVPGLSRYFRR